MLITKIAVIIGILVNVAIVVEYSCVSVKQE